MPDNWLEIDWADLFLRGTSPLETFRRGSVLFLIVFILFRVVPKRQMGELGISNLLVLVAEGIGKGLAGDGASVADGLIVVLTLMFWNYALNWSDYRVPALHRILQPTDLALVENGKVLRRNMQREFITMDELMSQLRLQGISDVSEVHKARLEADGRISVVAKDKEDGGGRGAPERIA